MTSDDVTDRGPSSRAFLKRAVTFLADEAGIRQFLDVGTGMPTAENTHQVAQAAAPDARIVYVDNDPLVLVHAKALLTGTPEGATEYIDADLRDPAAILRAASATTLDLSQPTGLILMNILGHVPDLDEAVTIVHRLMDALPSGSYLVTADGTNVIDGPAFEDAIVCSVGQSLACRREGHPGPRSGEEPHSQQALQLPDLLGQRRLGYEQPSRGAGEVSLGGDGGEVPQQSGVDIHATRLWRRILDAGPTVDQAWGAIGSCTKGF